MKNYLWTANGKFKKINILEKFDQDFSINNNQICIDDYCITKDDISFLKKQVNEYAIDKYIESKNLITINDAKKYVKFVFESIYNSPDNKKKEIINKYFSFGWYDKRTSFIKEISELYIDNIDFFDAYVQSDFFTMNSLILPDELVKEIKDTGRSILMGDDRLNFKVTNDTIDEVVPQAYYVMDEFYKFLLIRVKSTNKFQWKILLYTNDLVPKVMNMYDDYFKTTYKYSLDSIDQMSFNIEINSADFTNMIVALKAISITDGLYDFNIFKDNIFLKNYNQTLNLDVIDNNYFEILISNFRNLNKLKFNYDQILELKNRLGVENISDIYYKLLYTEQFPLPPLPAQPPLPALMGSNLGIQNKPHISHSYITNLINNYDDIEEIKNETISDKVILLNGLIHLISVILFNVFKLPSNNQQIINMLKLIYNNDNVVGARFPNNLVSNVENLINYLLSDSYNNELTSTMQIKDYPFNLRLLLSNIFYEIKSNKTYFSVNNFNFYDNNFSPIGVKFGIDNTKSLLSIPKSYTITYNDEQIPWFVYIFKFISDLTLNFGELSESKFIDKQNLNIELFRDCIINIIFYYYASLIPKRNIILPLRLMQPLINKSDLKKYDIYEIENSEFRIRNFIPSTNTIINEITEMINSPDFSPLDDDFTINDISDLQKQYIQNMEIIINSNNVALIFYRNNSFAQYDINFNLLVEENTNMFDYFNSSQYNNLTEEIIGASVFIIYKNKLPGTPVPRNNDEIYITQDQITKFHNSNIYLVRILEEVDKSYKWKLLYLENIDIV